MRVAALAQRAFQSGGHLSSSDPESRCASTTVVDTNLLKTRCCSFVDFVDCMIPVATKLTLAMEEFLLFFIPSDRVELGQQMYGTNIDL